MNKQILLFLILSATVLIFGAFERNNEGAAALEVITQNYHLSLADFSSVVDEYAITAANFSEDTMSVGELQEVHLEARMIFKQMEYLIAYFDHEAVKVFLNGAPLPSVEKHVPEVRPLDPQGLQVLDELVFSNAPFEEKETIIKLVEQMKKDFFTVQKVQKSIKITHRHIFEALREEMVRLFTLGLTGFDTPGSGNALPEAKAVLQSVYEAYLVYQPMLTKKDFGLALLLDTRLSEAIKYMDNFDDFDTFDRMGFLIHFHNHIYELLYEAQLSLGVETKDEVSKFQPAVNYEARQLFDPQFLNNSYFANRKMDEENIDKRIALGRTLFFDPILSSNNKRSCASCHDPSLAFTDGEVKSRGFNEGGSVGRNSPTLINCVYNERYFYDMRQPNLERQIKHVVFDSMEFNTTFTDIIDKLKLSQEYTDLFDKAYEGQGRFTLSTYSLNDALASYVANLSSFDSPFDQYARQEIGTIDIAVQRGFNLFMGKGACGTCHFAPTFNGTVPPRYEETETEILGVPATKENKTLDEDLGRYASKRPIDEAPFYKHSFRTPTVRNIELTAPYMHNGVYEALEEVMDFYNKGGGAGMGIDVPYQTLPDSPLNLTDQEQQDIIAFMKSLTDTHYDQTIPERLPTFENNPAWNERVVGGDY
ncbi:MAG: cytochrome c peroxidase [Bacteroidota bacterium]